MNDFKSGILRLFEPMINLAPHILKQQSDGRKGEKPILHVLELPCAAGLRAEGFGGIWQGADIEE